MTLERSWSVDVAFEPISLATSEQWANCVCGFAEWFMWMNEGSVQPNFRCARQCALTRADAGPTLACDPKEWVLQAARWRNDVEEAQL